MRFRSLVLDYKAEALQIMREESNRERKRPRVIRILSDSCKESPAEGELETTATTQIVPRANSDPQALPSWLSGSPLNQCNTYMDPSDSFANAIVTPFGRTTAAMNKTDENGKSLGNLGSNDCNQTNSRRKRKDAPLAVDSEDTNRETKRMFDYKKLFSTPWLLEFVSAIRRRANRKRISNAAFEGCSQYFPTWYHDRCPNDSFSFCHRKIIRRLFDQCLLQRTHKQSSNRMETLMRRSLDRKLLPLAEQTDESKTSLCNDDRFSLSEVLGGRRGTFASLSLLHSQPSTAIVVYRGHSTTKSERSIQNLPLTENEKENSPLVPSNVWETAILTAAALCAYQQQRQKSKQNAMEEANTLENVAETRKLRFKTPTRYEGENQEDQFKTRPSLSENNTDYTQDQDHVSDYRHQSNPKKVHRAFHSTSVEKVIVSEICRPDVVATKKRKRPPPLLLLGENDNALLSEENHQSNANYTISTNHSNDTAPSHDTKSDPTADSNTKNSEQHSKSTPSKNRHEKSKGNELFLLQRFGLLPNKKSGSENETSMDRATNENDSDSSESRDKVVDGNDAHICVSVAAEDGCSSPIEFPVCFDDYDEEEEQDDDFNYGNSTKVEEKGDHDATPVSNTAYLTPKNAPSKNGQAPIAKDLIPTKTKLDVDSFADPSNEDIAVQSSTKQKNKKKKKRRKRTAEEKILRKQEKRRRKESKSKKTDKRRGNENKVDSTDEDRTKSEGEKLETPRKMDFQKFSPVKTSTKGAVTEKPENLLERSCLTRTSEKRLPAGHVGAASNASKQSVPFIQTESAPLDPFSIDPSEILETYTCNSDILHGNGSKFERVRANGLGLNATKDPDSISFTRNDTNAGCEIPIRILCSERFIESFGETVSEITRINSASSVSQQKTIQFIDTNLVDVCSVDIEIPSRVAMVVSTMSQIQNSGGLMANFLPRIVEVAACNRYTNLVVFLCVDVSLDSTTARDLVRLQSAFLSCDRGLPRTHTTIQVCSKQSLAASISSNISRFIESENGLLSNVVSKLDHWLSDERASLRLKLLLSIIPTLSVIGALYWLELSIETLTRSSLCDRNQHPINGDKTSKWFQNVFQDVEMEKRRLESYLSGSNLKDFMNPSVPNQLASVVNIHLKHY